MTGAPLSPYPDLPRLAISVRQPWAWAIVHAGKDVENRDWTTRYRGPICIHAAKGMTKADYDEANAFMGRFLGPAGDEWLMRWHGLCAAPYRLDRGAIVGVATIADCVDASDSPWFMGRYGFLLRDVRPVDPIPVRGALNLFDWRRNLAMGEAA